MSHEIAPSHSPKPARQVAVIDIGTASIRMAIGEIAGEGDVRTLETLSQTANLGRDTFTRGTISKQTIEELRESARKVIVACLQRVRNHPARPDSRGRHQRRPRSRRTGWRSSTAFTSPRGWKLSRSMRPRSTASPFWAFSRFLAARGRVPTCASLIAEVGGGSTELLVVKDSDVIFSHVYRLGSLASPPHAGSLSGPHGEAPQHHGERRFSARSTRSWSMCLPPKARWN